MNRTYNNFTNGTMIYGTVKFDLLLVKETKEQMVTSNIKTSYYLIDKLLRSLYKLQADYMKHNVIYLTKSSCRKLRVGLAFCYSKSTDKNATKVKDLFTIIDIENLTNESVATKQIIPFVSGIISLIKQGKDNYELDEIHYLMKCLAPLFYKENQLLK